ncbi:MAG: tryptophan 2,3-dioxygenase family protein [Nonlabens sp.]|uniref:tryptophan 2,3-dioxygenase family protein n=1 Tax=Nonlabens sp. TaxID=1888209 RepID=UPI003EF8B73E
MSQEISPEIAQRIKLLEEKFKNSGQDMTSYLDGLLYDKYLTYWDYIRVETLLSLQVTSTEFPDELIFLSYHQISELYLKLIIHEQKQIIENENLTGAFFKEKALRINTYFSVMINSFEVMITGMERDQFLKFRMSLLPASGFQSAQYRMVEFYSTDLINLVHPSVRSRFRESGTSTTHLELYDNVYWKKGGIDMDTGEKTLTLKQFEERYTPRFLRIIEEVESSNLNQKYLSLPEEEQTQDLKDALRTLDQNTNINWKLMHTGAAHRYLRKEGKAVKATGGTNWKEFLPPSFQKICFFPTLWTEKEHEEWGQQWVNHVLNTK